MANLGVTLTEANVTTEILEDTIEYDVFVEEIVADLRRRGELVE